MKPRQFRYYDLLVHVFVGLLLISNLVGQKITKIGPVTVGGALGSRLVIARSEKKPIA